MKVLKLRYVELYIKFDEIVRIVFILCKNLTKTNKVC